MALTISHILQESESRLKNVDSPRLSAEVIIADVLHCSRLSLCMERDSILCRDDVHAIRALVSRRERGEPLAYILGKQEFYGREFTVSSDVLIPRPETEHIVEEIEALIPKSEPFRFADWGTGSGILAVTIARLYAHASGVAVDLSREALAVAGHNAAVHDVEGQLAFCQGDFTVPLFIDEAFDIIVSNPPYVSRQEYEEASHEVTDFEPVMALVSGEDGLRHIQAMVPHASAALKKDGYLLMEIGYRQAADVKKFVGSHLPQLELVGIVNDLAGHDRVAFFQKK